MEFWCTFASVIIRFIHQNYFIMDKLRIIGFVLFLYLGLGIGLSMTKDSVDVEREYYNKYGHKFTELLDVHLNFFPIIHRSYTVERINMYTGSQVEEEIATVYFGVLTIKQE